MKRSDWSGRSAASSGRGRLLGRITKLTICASIVIPVFYLLQKQLADMDHAQISSALRSISWESLALSGLFTAISLFAVARYDVLAIRQLGYRIPDKLATKSGFAAVSLGQTLGFGLFVGAVARWRFYRGHGIGPKEAGVMSGLVTVGFLNGFAVVLAVAAFLAPQGLVTMTGASETMVRVVCSGVLLFGLGFVLVSIFHPHVKIGSFTIKLPKLRVLRAQVLLAALDTIPAAIALWVLIPSELAPSLLMVIPVYLTALGLGLVSNSPGGLGVLELTCLMALPVLPPEQLMAALIAYRGVYYGVPAVLAIAMLVAREVHGDNSAVVAEGAEVSECAVSDILATSNRAEAHLASLGDKTFIISNCKRSFLMFVESGNSLIALSDPVGPTDAWTELVQKFEDKARDRMLTASYYKIGPEFASLLEGTGRFATQLASEAVVQVADFSTSGSKFRELRRKLKAAEKAGLTLVHHRAGTAPMANYACVNEAWAQEKGGERGFSMGYFCPKYLRQFESIEARLNDQTVAFLTLWRSGDGHELGLDVMRLAEDAPDGTMHALVHAAIGVAKVAGASRFSLCAVPFMICAETRNWVEQTIAYVFDNKPDWHKCGGLARFKNAFRPEWEPRFAAAPGMLSAGVAAVDVTRVIHAPVRAADDVELVDEALFQPAAA